MLGIIIGKIDDVGYAPSYREMAKAMGLRSIGNIRNLLGRLQYKGWIRVKGKGRRAIDVLFRPVADASGVREPSATPAGGTPTRPELFRSRHVSDPVEPEPAVVITRRHCLKCAHLFDSTGPGNRLCGRCKAAAEWSSGDDLAIGA